MSEHCTICNSSTLSGARPKGLGEQPWWVLLGGLPESFKPQMGQQTPDPINLNCSLTGAVWMMPRTL